MAAGSLKIGKIFGINIEVHWTLLLLLLFALVLSTSDYLLFIIVVLLFVSVLLHELAHSITALRNHIRVKEIVLNIIGGASVIDEVGISPEAEFRISVVGPITSLFLAGLFGTMVIFTGVGILTYLLQVMFELNLLLGIFNILPAFPMDGGRVLRSYLSESRSEYDATMTTVKVSNAITGLFVLGSIAYVLLINGSFLYKEFNFFILLIIAVFLYGGAQAERERARIKKDTQGLTVGSLAGSGFVLVDRDVNPARLYQIAAERREHIILIKGAAGYLLVDPFRSRSGNATSVAQLATPVATMKPSTGVFDALSMIEATGVNVGVVVRANKVVGVVTSQKIQAFMYLHIMGRRQPRAGAPGAVQ